MTRLLIVLSLAALACVAPSTLAVSPPAATATPAPTATIAPLPEYTAVGYVYIRDASGVTAGDYFSAGDIIRCRLDGDWCILADDTRVWAGCLDPNPAGRGCRER